MNTWPYLCSASFIAKVTARPEVAILGNPGYGSVDGSSNPILKLLLQNTFANKSNTYIVYDVILSHIYCI